MNMNKRELRDSLSSRNNRFFNKHRRPHKICSTRGQIWIETVIYTLIGLAVIGILLAVSKPKIEQMKDKIIIEQTISSLNEISTRIYDVQIAPGNKRILNLKISKGKFYVNATEDKVGWILESNYKYSQLGSHVSLGNMDVYTTEGNPYIVEISMNYQPVNLTNEGKENYVSYDGNPTPYRVAIENQGKLGNERTNIDLIVD